MNQIGTELWAAEPLALWLQDRDPPAAQRGRTLRFEISSRGDRVPGALYLPAGPQAAPLVVLMHATGSSKDAPFLKACSEAWLAQRAAVACFDLPLHGERESAKLTETFLAAFEDRELLDPERERLCAEFGRQSLCDARRTLDALAGLPEIDERRVAVVGFGLGAVVGAHWSADDGRVGAVALALIGGGIGALDPSDAVRRIAPRPLLFVNAKGDERVPRRAARALHAAAGDKSEVVWVEGGHAELGASGTDALQGFVTRELRL